jgi:formylglycine-generating enzyme required for sulfatase activity
MQADRFKHLLGERIFIHFKWQAKLTACLISLILVSCSNPLGSNTYAQTSFLSSPTSSLSCPTGYVLVPHNSTYTSNDFCVSKYIASQSGSIAQSVPLVAPWVNITQTSAITACQANGSRYDLITNAEWQTVAQNIELIASNWSGGVIGSVGGLNAGTNNNFNSSGVAANSDDTQGCYLTGQACTTNWNSQKRTFTLSNGNIVWDMAGNVYQWEKDTNSTNFGAGNYTSQITSASNPTTGTLAGGNGIATGNATFLFGPTGNYTALNSGAYGGLGYAFTGTAGGIVRGGAWGNGSFAGLFFVVLNFAPSSSNANIGFRCVYH